MGSFYRSKHELVFAFKVGTAPHVNSFGLGETGRYRTNVWDYAGISSISSSRAEDLAMHPTVKPVALVADAIRDCSRRGDIVLDPFGGSGTTLIAADKCGRAARLIEYDPGYCDTIIARWERLTGKQAMLVSTGEVFEDTSPQPITTLLNCMSTSSLAIRPRCSTRFTRCSSARVPGKATTTRAWRAQSSYA
jgi:hypothetical protein